MSVRNEGVSVRQRMRGAPKPLVDMGLGLMVAVAVIIAIGLPPNPGRPPDALAYALGLTIAALVLIRRRWPMAVLVASAATLQLYYLLDYAGIRPAVPLSVALATPGPPAIPAGHCWWPPGSRPHRCCFEPWSSPNRCDKCSMTACRTWCSSGAVLLLGEAVRNRRDLDLEREKSERLLLNVLPTSIATRLKQTEAVIADGFPDVTVMFADIVDFTRRSERIAPEQVVERLNDLFSVFDQLARKRGLEKIKTIGDAYMVVGGLPDPAPTTLRRWPRWPWRWAGHVDPGGQPLEVRISIDTGPVVAGVIGTSRFSYDLWGDTVNTASRMESMAFLAASR
jgi:class 3 adenylate cyclase